MGIWIYVDGKPVSQTATEALSTEDPADEPVTMYPPYGPNSYSDFYLSTLKRGQRLWAVTRRRSGVVVAVKLENDAQFRKHFEALRSALELKGSTTWYAVKDSALGRLKARMRGKQ